jgi:hypothetical protein|tara:strand:+ start:114 stop:254 length:141 start_codon:yes stop_codon:yes gene_type:complete
MRKKKKTIGNLRKIIGSLPKDDREYENAMKELRPLYRKWAKRIQKL